MKITALRLFNVKRFAGRGVAIEGIGDGVNVLCAVNEFGKSTSFEALHALFFQRHSGKSGAVTKLRPYSGGSPLVEADIATVEGRFRIAKQYYSGGWARVTDIASGRLLAQADEAENFIAGLIKGGTAGPAGLLWVRQGITGIEKQSDSEEKDEKVRRSLVESVQGEVEAVTGGRRMADIIDAVTDELGKLITTRGPKIGGRYASAVEEHDRLVAEEQKLSGEVAALREALDKRALATKRLAELGREDDRQERRNAIEAAQLAFDAAKARSGMLKTAETELKFVRERRDSVGGDLANFRDALEKAEQLKGRLRDAEQHRNEAIDKRRVTADAIEKARADAAAAETEEQEMRDLFTRLDAALKAKEKADQLADLKERLREAEATRRTLEEGEAKLALLEIKPGDIDALQEIELEIATLRAVEAAARPSVAIAYDNDASVRVTVDGTPLMDGEERGFDGQARLVVPGVGTITLRSNRAARSDGRLEQGEEKRRGLLDAMGVADLAAARERQMRAQQMDGDLRVLRDRLSLLAPKGLPTLRAEVEAHSVTGAEIPEMSEDPAQVRAAHAETEERRKAARLALREVEPMQKGADEAFIAAETALASLKGEQAQVNAILGPQEERGERERVLANALEDLSRQLAGAEEAVETLRAAAVDLDSAEARLRRARSVEETVEKEINKLREDVAGLNGKIVARSDEAVEEKWREAGEALVTAKARVAAFEKEVAVSQRLLAALESARSEARETYLKPVMAELRPLLGLLFDDVSITFDDKTLLPHKILRNGQEEDVDRLSGGMREQLSVLTRLAFARLLARDGRPAPVILDDALVYSDDDRIEKMFDALHRQSKDQQIIVFSCRQRAFQKLGGTVLRMTDWQP
ncbi:AAA family ATPase [Phyllobacterium leguminum]|uniref:DNA repair exonuclease SbcCD ATPase subunit n=1 Tax=Phyllobacterium leguminum TaxID=314237 RepID=A0A318SXB6_9HYPH|nr:DNA-binding protein [Phyllobacterium leguminum]PYE86585.1 DNA repair exonuclease SbcCD ATPase subunit [Phyllobacterium leguminum]